MSILASISNNNRNISALYTNLMTNKKTFAQDSASLSAASRMESQIRGLNQVVNSQTQATEALKIADAGMAKLSDTINLIKELTIQYNSADTANQPEIQNQIDELVADLKKTMDETTFNGKKLIGGTAAAVAGDFCYSSGVNVITSSSGSAMAIKLEDLSTSVGGITLTKDGSAADITILDAATDAINAARTKAGMYSSRLDITTKGAETMRANLEGAFERITQPDSVRTALEYQKATQLQQYQMSMLGGYLRAQGNILDLLT